MIAFINSWPEHEVLYILRPKDGVSKGKLPDKDPTFGKVLYRVHSEEGVEDLYVAFCESCGGNCGQCGTSVGMGVAFNFDHIIMKSGLWK